MRYGRPSGRALGCKKEVLASNLFRVLEPDIISPHRNADTKEEEVPLSRYD